MKKLPPAKRNNLIMVIVATIAVISAVYFLMIKPQNESNAQIGVETSDKTAELVKIETSIRQADATTVALADINQQLAHSEEDIATGDVFAWTYDTIRHFKTNYHVDIPNVGQPTLSDVDLVPSFPYKQVRVSLSGTAYYHDLGKFIADFENTYPHMRMVNLSIEPSVQPGGPTEKLAFRVDVIALVKPNT
jgi:Tfp pilus assembly protein PilO